MGNKLIERLKDQSIRDGMTGMLNRRGFYEHSNSAILSIKDKRTVCTMVIDMDGLKGINDSYGHHEGDFAIKAMSDAISLACGTVNICGRFGGDEFVILGTGSDFAEKFKKRLTARLASQNRKHDKPYKLSASLGYITTVPKSTDSLFDLIQKADERMYEVKKENRTHRI